MFATFAATADSVRYRCGVSGDNRFEVDSLRARVPVYGGESSGSWR